MMNTKNTIKLDDPYDDEDKVAALRNAVEEGINSGIAVDFEAEEHLRSLKGNQFNDELIK